MVESVYEDGKECFVLWIIVVQLASSNYTHKGKKDYIQVYAVMTFEVVQSVQFDNNVVFL